jgi:hypothetical protein
MPTFYLKTISSTYFTITSNSTNFIIFMDIDFINIIYIKCNKNNKYFYNDLYKLPKISGHSVFNNVLYMGRLVEKSYIKHNYIYIKT